MPAMDDNKKRKFREKAYGFRAFSDPGFPLVFSGPFRDNVRQFLRECCEVQDYSVEGMPTWCTLLIDENSGVSIPLYLVEESVKYSFRPFCDHCRCMGWSHHFVSKRRYHFIIPASDVSEKPLGGGETPRGTVFDGQSHLLHGLIHCNGFGHLLCINGREGGSKYLNGREIMDLWDRLCNMLRTRKITVVDVSKKRSMELRLLHSVAYGNSWFGRWGYQFSHGSFGITQHKYIMAIDILSELPLETVVKSFNKLDREIEIYRIIRTYRGASEIPLISIRDLLLFMLDLKARLPLCDTSKNSTAPTQRKIPASEKRKHGRRITHLVSDSSCRWSAKRLELAAQVIVDALKENGSSLGKGMPRQDVRNAARLHIGDTGLLDFVLKSLGNCVVGTYVVRRAVNSATKVLEYTLEDVDGVGLPEIEQPQPENGGVCQIGQAEIYKDMVYIYKSVIESYMPDASTVMPVAAKTILDAKHFIKAWPFIDDDDEMLRFMCSLMPAVGEEAEEFTRQPPSPELVVLPLYATVGDLREAAAGALRDTYCIMERFVARVVEGIEGEDGDVLFGAVESGSHVCVRGSGVDLRSKLRYEGGEDNWTVDCRCGARDDDGERMVACDVCEVWQHTRCEGIADSDAVPQLFLCSRCGTTLLPSRGFEAMPEYG